MTGAGSPLLPFTATAQSAPIALKAGGAAGHGTQARADYLAQAAARRSASAFKKAFAPVLKLLERANSLEELRELMEDDDRVAALYKQMTDPGVMRLRPYWQYDAVNDSHTRPSHLLMDGRVFPADSPVWDTWFPPNGFRCRCTVKTLSKRQVEARGLTVETKPPKDIAPDPHFNTNPAKVPFEPDLKGYPEPLVKAFRRRERERKEG